MWVAHFSGQGNQLTKLCKPQDILDIYRCPCPVVERDVISDYMRIRGWQWVRGPYWVT